MLNYLLAHPNLSFSAPTADLCETFDMRCRDPCSRERVYLGDGRGSDIHPTELRDRSSPKGPKSAGKSAARSGPCLCKRMSATTCVFGGRILRLAVVMRHRIC